MVVNEGGDSKYDAPRPARHRGALAYYLWLWIHVTLTRKCSHIEPYGWVVRFSFIMRFVFYANVDYP